MRSTCVNGEPTSEDLYRSTREPCSQPRSNWCALQHSLARRSVYFGRNRARPAANARSLLPVGEDDRCRDREGIGRKTPAF